MNSLLASNINGGFNNQQVANGSSASVLLSSIDFTVTDRVTNYSSSQQGKSLIKLSDSEDILCNGQNKAKNYDENKNKIENYASVNGNKDKSEDSIPVPKLQLYTGKIHGEWNQVYKIGAGLNNLGNTCFMNTVIQCLTYCPPLANYLLNDNDHASKCTMTGFCMMCLLQRHMRKTIGKTGEIIKPIDIYQRLRAIAKHFQFGRQEDAHEFLRYVIDHLWKACLSQVNGLKLDSASKETTVINKIFGGYHRSQVICLRCKKKSNTFDHFMDFILDIKQNVMSLEKALEKFIQPELLQQENCYKCPKCKMKVEAQKRFSVFQAPLVATFQLKRFDFNRSFGGKITKQITYPERLNLRPYMSDTQGDPVWYRLNAVLVHSGPSCNAGHYYCYVKNSNSCWYIMDDSRVHQVSLNQVLNQSAYVLFYIRMENSEKTPLKKCLESKNSFIKGTISSSPLPKVAEINNVVRSMPLISDSNSPFSNSKPYNSPNSVRKFNSFAQPDRGKISFKIQNSATSTQLSSPKNKIASSEPVPVKRSGLVPYMEDSSESSDASESCPSQNKSNSIASTNGEHLLKIGSLDSYKKSPQLEVKAKLSKSVFSSPSYTFVNNTPHKVSATDPWIVTDAPQTPISSSSSSTGVNSTTDWDVIEAADLALNTSPSIKSSCSNSKESLGSTKDSKNSSEKETSGSSKESYSAKETLGSLKESKNSLKESSGSVRETKSNCVKEPFGSPKISISEMSPSKYSEKSNGSCHSLSSGFKISDSPDRSPSTENCDFRKQISRNKSYFPENDEINSVKRKYCDSNSKISKDSPNSEHNESRCSPSPKKIKCENSSFVSLESDSDVRNSDSKRKNSDSNSASSTVQQRHTSNCDNSRTCNGVSNYNDNVFSPTKNSNYSPVKSKLNSPEKDRLISKGNQDKCSSENPNSYPLEKSKQLVSDKGSNAYLYGTDVARWNDDNRSRPSHNSGYEVRKEFDEYDNDFDRGKVRKSKMKDHYRPFQQKNHFQNHADRYHGKYNNNRKFFRNDHQNYRSFEARHHWKSNQRNGYRKWNRTHHRY